LTLGILVIAALILAPIAIGRYLRTRTLPPRVSEDDLMLHSIKQDWRERLMQ
jgi:hypothetical protein